MANKILPVALPPEMYAILERTAQAEDRDAVQQARHMLKQALLAAPPRGDEADGGSPQSAA